ncbi:MAG: 3-phosphoshikimate 1-carboxyvinyltransferase [Elusimicrobia bacterium RIFOXYA2_FULL_39_19]|nr:MAG: 3-phosphoshikimate 1-carboxyvinyltransferase [Elusimicrobia bacterium RIFOXYA2_FULL_39_19]
MPTIKIKPKLNINATLKVPGDKSITHRSVIFAGLAQGHCTVYDYLDGDDCRRTIEAFRQCGIEIKKDKTQLYIEGKGLNGLKAPEIPINAGNSGTTIRLLSGVFAGQNFETEMFGDASLSKRPMKRVMEPLGLMGVKIQAANSQYPPLKITGNPDLKPITYNLPIASAQVKSAVLLAGLQAHGKTTVIEPGLSRDHTERLLEYFGAKIKYKNNIVTVEGKAELKAKDIYVPGDFSSAAFFIAAGLLAKKSKIKIENVGLNEGRTGFLKALETMGAKIKIENFKIVCNEPVGDIVAEVSSLKGITLDTALVPQLIDEIPLLVLIASQAQGKTVIKGAGELRVKESDRIKAISSELKKMGAVITELEDGFIVDGPVKLHGAIVESYDDHRIAMTTAIAGLCADGETEINNSECVDISFPNFWELIEKI